MLCRRAHPLRRSSRRQWAFYSRTALSEQLEPLLSTLPDQLKRVVALLKQNSDNLHIRETANSLAALSPAEDTERTIMRDPGTLLWWEDLVQLLPSSHYSSYILAYVRWLREAITSRALTMGEFVSLQRLAPEQLQAFLRLLRIEHVNEVEEHLAQALTKAFECVHLLVAQMERIHSILQTRQGEMSEATMQAASAYFQAFYSVPLRDQALPAVLNSLLELPEHSLPLTWLNRLLPSMAHYSQILPIAIEDLTAYAKPLFSLSETEELAYIQRVILRLSFPQLLLYSELSSECGLIEDWQLQHSLSFPVFIREAFYDHLGGLVCVFTRDMRDTQLLLEVEYMREKVSSLSTVEDLYSSLEAFLQNPYQRLYVLDYFLDTPQIVDVETCKTALEAAGQASQAAKLLCLLVRLPPNCPALPGTWHTSWRLISMESLSETFSTSLEWLQIWLKRDTNSYLLSSEFLESKARVEAILSAYMPDCMSEIRDLARNDDFCALLSERIRMESQEHSDWKVLALQCSTEAFLKAAVETVLTAVASSVLAPVLSMVKSLQAFPSFLLSSADSLPRRLWKATFLQLVPSLVPPQSVVRLRYPFVLLDYHSFLSPGTTLTAFHESSVTTLHLRTSHSSLTLLHQYLEDMMTLDLANTCYEWQGKKLFESLCDDSKTFEEAMGRYCEHRNLVLCLCQAERLPLLDHFFEELLGSFPGKTLHMSKSDLVKCLENYQEELCFLRDSHTRVFAIESSSLLVFNCSRKRVSITRLTACVEAKHSSVILLELSSLFCCGGVISSWMRSSYTGNTYIITFPKAVSAQAQMLQARSYHGLALCRGHVYAIGGVSDLMSLRRCEKFSMDAGHWLELPERLSSARSYFTPLVYSEKIYLLGGSSSVGEVIDSSNDKISVLSLSLPVLDSCISLVKENKALVLGKGQTWEVDLDSLSCQGSTGAEGTLWSSYPPVLYQGEIFMVDKDWVFKWLSLSGSLLGSLKQS